MANNLFSSLVQTTVSESVRRARVKSEDARQNYATELLDTYNGFSKLYVERLIDQKTKNQAVKEGLKELIVAYPLLQTFVDEISMIYAEQPKREFYLEDKMIVEKAPEGADKTKYLEDKELHETLEKVYSRKLKMQLKKAEVMTNLLQTTIYKINNRNNQIVMDFIANDMAVVASLVEDTTTMGAIKFLKSVSTINQIVTPIYEYWDAMQYQIDGDKNTGLQPNRAAELAEEYWKSRTIESGVAPFCVFRTELADDDFWNLKDQDLVETIKQINLAITELRYLIRYSSFGLKYIANLEIVGSKTLDPLGIWNLKKTDKVPGQDQKDWEVGELKNEGRLTDVVESLKFMITLLFQFYGININSLVGTGNVQSAESKNIDKESVIRYIRYQKDMWQLNEEILLKNIICVWNRDNDYKIDPKLEVKLCFEEDEEMADDLIKRAELWILKIQNNIASALDWIRSENKGISEKEAEAIYKKNQDMNKSAMPEPAIPTGGDGQDNGDNPDGEGENNA